VHLGAAGSVGAAALAACGVSPAAPDAGGAGPAALKGTLRYRTWWAPTSAAHQTWWDFVKPDFETRFAGATLDLEFVPFGEMFDKFVASAAAGDVPDALHSSIVWARDFWDQGALEELSPYVARDASLAADKFIPAALHYNQAAKKVFGIPHEGPDANILYYNADHFRAVGLDPAPGAVEKWVWDDVLQAATRLTRPGAAGGAERTGFLVPNVGLPEFAAWVYTQGATFYTKEETGVGFDNERGESVLQLYLDLLRRAGPPPAGVGRDLFLQGQVSILFANLFMIGDLRLPAVRPAFDWGVMAFPKGPLGRSRSTNVFVNMDLVPRGSKRKDAAAAWLTYYAGLEMGRERMRRIGRLNPRKAFYDSAEFKEAVADQAQTGRIPDLASVGNAYPYLRFTEVTRDAQPYFAEALAGKRSPKEAVREAARAANGILGRLPQR
jgi:multiple sugar transport system substrate-binding protein